MTARASLRQEARGAVFVEHCIVLVPVLVLALSTWQLVELWVGDLVLRRAAGAAARAAAVVLPDDPAFYGEVPAGELAGARRAQIELAAALVVATSPYFRSKPRVELSAAAGHGVLSAHVSAPFDCVFGWLALVCGGDQRVLSASASASYQGARYRY